MAYQKSYPITIGGGGYTSTSSAFPAVRSLSTYGTTSTRYVGFLSSGSTDYNMQTQFEIDVSEDLPEGAIITSTWFKLEINHSASAQSGYMHICRDNWGVSWSNLDMEIATVLDNYSTCAWKNFGVGWSSGVQTFASYDYAETYYNEFRGTATKLQYTITSKYLSETTLSDPGSFSNYGGVQDNGNNEFLVNYVLPFSHSQMLGCNI